MFHCSFLVSVVAYNISLKIYKRLSNFNSVGTYAGPGAQSGGDIWGIYPIPEKRSKNKDEIVYSIHF